MTTFTNTMTLTLKVFDDIFVNVLEKSAPMGQNFFMRYDRWSAFAQWS